MIFISTRRAPKFTNLTSRRHASFSTYLLQLVQLSIDRHSLKLTQQSHARICLHGFHQHTVTVTKLISAYSLFNNLHESRLLFDSIRVKDVYLWNTLINVYARNNLYDECFNILSLMCRSHDSPDAFTFSTLAKVSGDSGDLLAGESVHAKCTKTGFVADTVLLNSLMSMYDKCGKFGECWKLFGEMPLRNVASWNVIIAGYANFGCNGFDEKMLGFLKCMQDEGFKPNEFTVSSVLPLCKGNEKWDYGREFHCYIVKNGLDLAVGSDVHLGTCLIDIYSKSQRIKLSRRVFDRMKFKNIFAWTSMINGYVQSGDLYDASCLFLEMQGMGGIEPNVVSLLSVLPACGLFASLRSGKEIHGFAIRRGLNNEISLCNSLIDVYCKCGSLNYAKLVFENGCVHKNTISWTTMISGYGYHGKGDEAIALFDNMLHHGVKPDMVTIVGVLSACCRSGLVKEGIDIYRKSVHEFGIEPAVEISACMVDMLGRSGQFDEALDIIKTMPVEPSPSVWGALVNASVLHGNQEMLDFAYKYLIQIEPGNPSNYVSLSNLCASSQRWDLVEEMRTTMKERGLKKLPGCSWISINNETHSFYVADKAHPRSDMIYEMLNELISAMKEDEAEI